MSAVAPSGEAELRRLIAEVDRRSPPSYSLTTELLAFLTAQHFHEPKLTVKYGRALIIHHRSQLGDKGRLLSAAAEREQSKEWCLEALLVKFGNAGLRMRRVLGLHCEYNGRWEEASEHYEAVLAADPTNIPAHKRLIAVAKSRGRVEDALARLVKYTKTFAADEGGWLDLAELYVGQQQLDLAAFCLEECILCTPENHQYHTRYAEVSGELSLLYAGGRYELARQHFAQAVELKPNNNLRALYGLIMCLRIKPSPSGAALYAWSVEKLLNHYRKYAPAMLPIVQHSLELAALPAATPSLSSSPSPAITAQTSSSITTSAVSTISTSTTSTASSPVTGGGAKSVAGLTTAGVRITDSAGRVVQSGEEQNGEAERVASVLAETGLRERAVPATKD